MTEDQEALKKQSAAPAAAPSPAPDPATATRPDASTMKAPSEMDWTGKSDEDRVRYMQQWRAARALAKPAGEATRARALRSAGTLAKGGQAVVDTLQQGIDASNSTTGRIIHTGASALTGVNTRSAVNNVATLGQLAGHEAIARDAGIQAGYDTALDENRGAHATFTSTMAKDSGASAKDKFRAAARLVGKQVKLGVYQDLTKREGVDEYSKDETIGTEAKGAYKPGDTIAKDDHVQGSLHGDILRALKTGRLDQRGKLSDAEKQEIAGHEDTLAAMDATRLSRANTEKGSLAGQAKRLAETGYAVKLTDDQKKQVSAIEAESKDREAKHEAAKKTIRANIAKVEAEHKALQKSHDKHPEGSPEREKHAAALVAKAAELKAANEALDKQKATNQAARDGAKTRTDDIRAAASGEFTSVEKKQRAEIEAKIAGVRRAATDEGKFAAKYEGQTINAYGRVDNGITSMLDDPEKMKATLSGQIAQGAHAAGRGATTAGMVVGGNADDAQQLMQQGDHKLAAATSVIGLGSTAATAAGVGHAVTAAQGITSSTLKTAGAALQGMSAEAAAEETKRQHAREVASGERKASLADKSFFTMRKQREDPTFAQGAIAATKLAVGLGPDVIGQGVEKIKDATGLNSDEAAGPGDNNGVDHDEHGPEAEHVTGSPDHVGADDAGADHANVDMHGDHAAVDDSAVDHSAVDHSAVDHSTADHAAVGHPAVDAHEAEPSLVDQAKEQVGSGLDAAADKLKETIGAKFEALGDVTASAREAMPDLHVAPAIGAAMTPAAPTPAPPTPEPRPRPAKEEKLGWWGRLKKWVGQKAASVKRFFGFGRT